MTLNRTLGLRRSDLLPDLAAAARDLHPLLYGTLVSGDPACRPYLSRISPAANSHFSLPELDTYECPHFIHIITFEKGVLTVRFNTSYSCQLEVVQSATLPIEVSQLSPHPSPFGAYICLMCFMFGRSLSCPRLGPAHEGHLSFRMLVRPACARCKLPYK